MGKGNLARFKLLMVGHEFLCCENKPYWLGIGGRCTWGGSIDGEEILGRRRDFFLLRCAFDVLQKCPGCSERLRIVSFVAGLGGYFQSPAIRLTDKAIQTRPSWSMLSIPRPLRRLSVMPPVSLLGLDIFASEFWSTSASRLANSAIRA